MRNEDNGKISLYYGELTDKCLIECAAKIKKAFPNLSIAFYEMLNERIDANGFCDDRLIDAVTYVIDNCRYPNPSIADFISYDKTVKYKTWYEMTVEQCWDQFYPVKFPFRPRVVWVSMNDIVSYNLERYMIKR